MAASAWERLVLRTARVDAAASTIPVLLYGTAWKKDRTADLVYQALCSGFTGVDTAAQPKHYREDLVGEGIRRALSEGKVKRENLYVLLCHRPLHSCLKASRY
jgi:diketogulonate reductase-like aldo/keto reductase